MRRRDFIALLGGAGAAWPIAARAQQPPRIRRLGVLMNLPENAEAQSRYAVFPQALAELGWTVGRNLQVDIRWGAADADLYRKYAPELVALAPDVILVSGTSALGPMQRATRTVPIVFLNITDPVGAGYVASLARPGGNATGFMDMEYGLSGKWLELLKQIAPRISRVAVLRDRAVDAGIGQFAAIQSVAPSFAVELSPFDMREAGEIERNMTTFVRGPNDGLIVTSSPLALIHRDLIITLAARHRLPAVYADRAYVSSGGLASYGIDRPDLFRRAAGYVDRILKGAKPADLPVQAPTKFELVINLKTAKALDLTVPPTMLSLADEVIE
jgi:putative ABC transport system substrate-binding protein